MEHESAGPGPRALVDDAVEQLEAAIYAGEIAAGARVSEQALAQRFGIGRGAIREAVRTLEGRGLLQRSPYAGTRVVNPSLDEVEQLLQAREALEGMASRLAAELMSLHETRALRACLAEHGKAVEADLQGGPFRRGTADNDFHVQIVRGSRNRWIYDMLCRDLYGMLRVLRLRSSNFRQRHQAAVEEHDAILVAIERRDPDEAERLMRLHNRHARENLLRLLGSKPLL